MTLNKAREVVGLYIETLSAMEGVRASAAWRNELVIKGDEVVWSYALWMLQEMVVNLDDWTPADSTQTVLVEDRFHRWLGFVQGLLCLTNVYTIDDMRDHNRPD